MSSGCSMLTGEVVRGDSPLTNGHCFCVRSTGGGGSVTTEQTGSAEHHGPRGRSLCGSCTVDSCTVGSCMLVLVPLVLVPLSRIFIRF